MHIDQKDFGMIFKATRKINRLQQVSFAAILDVSQGTISKIESGIMQPELSLWFNFLKSFNIVAPYCFTYGGVEFHESIYKEFKKNGAPLLPLFDFNKDKIIFEVKTIRPLVDFLMKNHLKVFSIFLKKNKIRPEVFYILNHPLTFNFADVFFCFLQEHKINEKLLTIVDLNFKSSHGQFYSDFLTSKNLALINYNFNTEAGTYYVELKAKNKYAWEKLESRDLALKYILFLPFYFLKSTNQCRANPPEIFEVAQGAKWQISYSA